MACFDTPYNGNEDCPKIIDHHSVMYKLGYRAGLNGKSVNDCPHYEHGPQRMDWIKGLNAGRAARINNQIITK